ncbi:MAG: metalloregulator ArsR/SmtB family transcription factor [Candidatus Buchananbacteria bacterium]|jgi:DNA-binding transcriptional ArsR family regulator
MPLSQTIQALSDANRRKILDLLKKGELPVAEINKKLDITGATLSHHLDILKRADLLSVRREGQQMIYSLNLSVFEEAAEQLVKFFEVKKPKNKSPQWRG